MKPDWRGFRDHAELLRSSGITVNWLVAVFNMFGWPDDWLSKTLSFLDRAASGGITPFSSEVSVLAAALSVAKAHGVTEE